MKNSIIRFTFSKIDSQSIDIDYCVFRNKHSELWLTSLLNNINSDVDTKLYGFSNENLENQLDKVNSNIDKINSKIGKDTIQKVNFVSLESDINYVHRTFVDNDQKNINFENIDSNLWSEFNSNLHGLEILSRSKNKSKKQIFVELKKQEYYDLPIDAYQHFSIRKVFGYCYANYAHVGRHLLEIYLANDLDFDKRHFVPMSRINGSSQLWFGDTTPFLSSCYEKNKIKEWYLTNNLQSKTNKLWEDPTLALGWLPVAKMISKIEKSDLENLKDLVKISYVE
jgi:hypothetical protein